MKSYKTHSKKKIAGYGRGPRRRLRRHALARPLRCHAAAHRLQRCRRRRGRGAGHPPRRRPCRGHRGRTYHPRPGDRAKTSEQNWLLLRGLDALQAMGHRLLVGVSRKRFLGELLDGRPATDRDAATAAVTTWCAAHGIWAVRTHEVPAQRDAAQVGRRLGALTVG